MRFLYRVAFITSFLAVQQIQVFAQSINITIKDSTIATVNEGFYGIQYHQNSYNNSVLLNKLKEIPIQYLRLWARPNEIHPNADEWNWEDMDRKIDETISAGYIPIICIYQSEEWYMGTPEDPWWNYEDAVQEWLKVVRKITQRYSTDIKHIILFDELNYLYPDQPYYISFSESADLYITSAIEIKNIAPDLLVGGPSGFSGWENGHWANYVYSQTQNDSLLDFISSNIFLSWDKNDTDKEIIDRTIWYEEAPKKIREMVPPEKTPLLMLDAFNASALWTIDGTKDGEKWTDPRNVNVFGGVYQTLAILHSIKGGFDLALRWETIGGYGIFDWYPNFNELPPYYAWKLLANVAGLKSNSTLLEVKTSEEPVSGLPHHSGMNVEGYQIQPFAIQASENQISIVLVNKYSSSRNVVVTAPAGMEHYKQFLFNENRTEQSLTAIEEGHASSLDLQAPPLSVQVITFSSSNFTSNSNNRTIPNEIELSQNYPNPFNPTTHIKFYLNKAGKAKLEVIDITGKVVKTIVDSLLNQGSHQVLFDGSELSSGVYLYRLDVNGYRVTKKLVLIK